VQVRLVTADQQDFAGNIGGGRRGEGSRDVADVDSVQAPVDGKRTFEEQRVSGEWHRAGLDADHAAEAQDHPLQIRGHHMLFGLRLVRAVEV
jgi:hypothetical protein